MPPFYAKVASLCHWFKIAPHSVPSTCILTSIIDYSKPGIRYFYSSNVSS